MSEYCESSLPPPLATVDLSIPNVLFASRKWIRNSAGLAVRILATRIKLSPVLEYRLSLADGSIIAVSRPTEVGVALFSAYLAERWGAPVILVVRSMVGLAKRLNDRVAAAYAEGERDARHTGGWTGAKEVALFLVTRITRPTTVVETGVAQGYSSAFILKALEDNDFGRLLSIDLPGALGPREYGRDLVTVGPGLNPGWLVESGSRDRWTLLLGDARTELPRINVQPDLFFHDSLHTENHMLFEFNWARSCLRSGGYLLSDDVGRNRAFAHHLEANSGAYDVMSKRGVGIARLR